jgi:agmatinase
VTTEYRFLSMPNAPLGEAQIVFLPVAHDDTCSGASGTAEGPRGLFEVSDQLELYEEDLGWSPFKHMKLCVRPELHRDEGESQESFHARLVVEAMAIRGPNAARFPIALGGEHSITPSVVSGYLSQPATIVIIDAHADLRPTYQGSAYSHACASYRLREQGHRLIIIGLRSLTDFEAARIEDDSHILVFWPRDVRSTRGLQSMMQTLAELQGDVWLSVDMDGFDPSEVPGTGTPQPDGLRWHTGIDIMRTLFENPNVAIRGMDVVELIPEPSRVSQMAAAKLVQKAISFWGKRHGYDTRPEDGAQSGEVHE